MPGTTNLRWRWLQLAILCATLTPCAMSQNDASWHSESAPWPAAQSQPAQQAGSGPAAQLYQQLTNNALDPANVYQIRGASFDREDVHITFEDGKVAFTKAVDGRITGLFFEGDGEVLIIPPDRVERWSLDQFTGSAILEERFTSAYMRFNDDLAAELQPFLRSTDDATAFVEKWDHVAQSLSVVNALRLLSSFVDSTRAGADGKSEYSPDSRDRMLYARVIGVRLGIFDVYYDTTVAEQVVVGHLTNVDGTPYYDLWTSFPSRSVRKAVAAAKGRATASTTIATQAGAETFAPDFVRVSQYTLQVDIAPPRQVSVDAQLEMEITEPGHRVLVFELSRYLKVGEVTVDGEPVEFLQNQALEGSALARRGNDVIAVVLPQAKTGRLTLRFTYAGEVLAEAGAGLMYVGARGIWYPNRGIAMSDFDMQFRYPSEWTLLATGTRASARRETLPDGTSAQVARWTTDRPIPFAGFNLGKYVRATVPTGNLTVESYAAHGMEDSFHGRQTVLVLPGVRPQQREAVVVTQAPDPSANAKNVANEGARAVQFLANYLGPYPYSSLALTQMPGPSSQGWPGLIFLSSYVFLSPEERAQLHLSPAANLFFGRMMETHEIAHEWMGDLLIWKSYREQWLVEAISNYCALAMLESEDPAKARKILEHYRQRLLTRNAKGVEFADAGPVTLGLRLNSSRFPAAYDIISYGRGTWLFHMLREMLLEPGTRTGSHPENTTVKRGSPDELFFRALRKIRQKFEGKEVTTRDLQQAFEEELPPSLWFEGRKSLDWFFDGWVNGTSIPKFELADIKFIGKAKNVVTGKIIQKQATEGLVTSVPIYAFADGKNVLIGREFVEGSETTFRRPVPPGTKKVLLDPYGTVLSRP